MELHTRFQKIFKCLKNIVIFKITFSFKDGVLSEHHIRLNDPEHSAETYYYTIENDQLVMVCTSFSFPFFHFTTSSTNFLIFRKWSTMESRAVVGSSDRPERSRNYKHNIKLSSSHY